ncbi:YdbL family protein [Myxococcota bacterium]|nr:YdbL family protein [Myxococcota bacterium]
MKRTAGGFLSRLGTAMVTSALLAISLFGADGALAQSLDNYRAAGQVGERTDGYVGIISANPDEQLRDFVGNLNEKRKQRYQAIARENDASLEAVASRAGQKLTQSARPGTYVQNPSGAWVRKK